MAQDLYMKVGVIYDLLLKYLCSVYTYMYFSIFAGTVCSSSESRCPWSIICRSIILLEQPRYKWIFRIVYTPFFDAICKLSKHALVHSTINIICKSSIYALCHAIINALYDASTDALCPPNVHAICNTSTICHAVVIVICNNSTVVYVLATNIEFSLVDAYVLNTLICTSTSIFIVVNSCTVIFTVW